MKWLVEVVPNYDVPAGVKDDLDNALLRNGELCRYLRGFKGTMIESDADKVSFEQEIEGKVVELNSRDTTIPSIKINWIDNRLVVDDDVVYKTLPAICEFFDKDIFETICHLVLYPVLNTYCPKGGAQ